jgi:hypothetical protein
MLDGNLIILFMSYFNGRIINYFISNSSTTAPISYGLRDRFFVPNCFCLYKLMTYTMWYYTIMYIFADDSASE